MEVKGENNQVSFGDRMKLSGAITGDNNTVQIGDALIESGLHVSIRGSGNVVRIAKSIQIKNLAIRIGTRFPAHNTVIDIRPEFSVEPGTKFLLPNSGNKLTIGANCMLSSNVTIRCGESPHLLFDRQTGEYLDVSDGVTLGDHVWVGENVYICKRATVANECVIGACSVVTGAFNDPYVVLAGNPARVTRTDVQWIRNLDFLVPGTKFHQSYHAHVAESSELLNTKNEDQSDIP